MRNIISVYTLSLILVSLTGCGTLNQRVGGPELSTTTIEYAKNIPSDNSYMHITYCEKEYSSNKWASKVYPIFPVFYWSTLGIFTPEPSYGVRTTSILFPVFVLYRDSLYDNRGQRLQLETTFNMDLVLGYEDRVTPKSYDFKTGILWLPGLGPFLGVGPEFFQLFWIPLTSYK